MLLTEILGSSPQSPTSAHFPHDWRIGTNFRVAIVHHESSLTVLLDICYAEDGAPREIVIPTSGIMAGPALIAVRKVI